MSVRNVSEVGLLSVGERTFAVGDRLLLRLDVDGRMYIAEAIVRHAQPPDDEGRTSYDIELVDPPEWLLEQVDCMLPLSSLG